MPARTHPSRREATPDMTPCPRSQATCNLCVARGTRAKPLRRYPSRSDATSAAQARPSEMAFTTMVEPFLVSPAQ